MDSAVLTGGDLEIVGRLAGASNFTLLARLGVSDQMVVYKPRRGEAPLWDFPQGTLCQREVAACLVARAAGWDFVPPTVLRDGPLGPGAVQLFIEHHPTITAFDLLHTHESDLKTIALFDLVANNADRKAGHVLLDNRGAIWGVDHGLCFHAEPKLRTVLWDFIGEPIPEECLSGLKRLDQAIDAGLSDELTGLLGPMEIDGLKDRIAEVLKEPIFPAPGTSRPYPWPPI